MTNTENDPTGAGWIITDDFFTHCEACGFDAGTHRPECLRSYGLGNLGNPNRPTGPNYCAQCGDLNRHNDFGRCWTTAHPMTRHLAEQQDRLDRIATLSPAQMRIALCWLAGGSDDHTEFHEALNYALSPEDQR